MTAAAGDRPCIEMGSRRTHEEAAVAAARAAYIAGFAATTNLEAGRRYGVPTTGTAAHAFTLLHDDERDGLRGAGRRARGRHDAPGGHLRRPSGVRTAVEVAGHRARRGPARLGRPAASWPTRVRGQLDDLGATGTRIIVTSDLDEYAIAALAAAPVDGYGVGTQLVTGSGAPTASMVYKLVARAGEDGVLAPVEKRSSGKASVGGDKWALRRLTGGVAVAEVVGVGRPPVDDGDDRALMVDLVRDGEVLAPQDVVGARARHVASRAELPPGALRLQRGEPAIPTEYVTA